MRSSRVFPVAAANTAPRRAPPATAVRCIRALAVLAVLAAALWPRTSQAQ